MRVRLGLKNRTGKIWVEDSPYVHFVRLWLSSKYMLWRLRRVLSVSQGKSREFIQV